jgi:hypothetical protein
MTDSLKKDLKQEIWKDIKGYEGLYQISNYGNIKRIKSRGRFLKGSVTNKGYRMVVLTKEKKERRIFVHRIIAQAFIPNPDNYPIVNHKNAQKEDNSISNLEWTTIALNNKHAGSLGLMSRRGEKHYRSKLNNNQVREIRQLYKLGKVEQKDLAEIYKVSTSTIGNIITRYRWNHVLDYDQLKSEIKGDG